MSFFKYLDQKIKSPAERDAERQKLLKEKESLQEQLDKLHQEWKKRRAHLAKQKVTEMKKSEVAEEADIKDELEQLTKELKLGAKSEDFGFDDAEKLNKKLEKLEKSWNYKSKKLDGNATCCPSNCRICEVDAEDDADAGEDEDDEAEENMSKQAKASLIA